MRNIEKKFIKLQISCPGSSSLINFNAAVRNGGFKRDTIRRWFNVLVEKEDYCGVPQKVLLDHAVSISNPSRTTRNEGESALRAPSFGKPVAHRVLMK